MPLHENRTRPNGPRDAYTLVSLHTSTGSHVTLPVLFIVDYYRVAMDSPHQHLRSTPKFSYPDSKCLFTNTSVKNAPLSSSYWFAARKTILNAPNAAVDSWKRNLASQQRRKMAAVNCLSPQAAAVLRHANVGASLSKLPLSSSFASQAEFGESAVELRFKNTPVSSVGTQVYVQTSIPNPIGAYEIRGTIRGPFSQKSQTLPTTFAITDLGLGPTVLGRVHVTDPCAWSTQLPSLYQAKISIHQGDKLVHEIRTDFGIRENTYAAGKSLWMGKRIVLRGVDMRHVEWHDISEWSNHNTVLFANEPTDPICRQATEQGVLMVARLCGTDNLTHRVRRLAAHPSVLVVWIDEVTVDKNLLEDMDASVLIAANINDANSCQHAALAVWQVADTLPEIVQTFDKPVLAIRPLQTRSTLAEARVACDQLQRDFAPQLNLAGYFV